MDFSDAAFAHLSKSIATAACTAFLGLRARHPETFYYYTLVTTGEALTPWPSAWSVEALDRAGDPILKWSYADSPYCGFGDNAFRDVRDLFELRGNLHDMADDEAEREYTFRLDAMEHAMRQLDSEGVFGTGAARDRCTIHAEVMPPDHTNMIRAKRLNSGAALEVWLREAAEED